MHIEAFSVDFLDLFVVPFRVKDGMLILRSSLSTQCCEKPRFLVYLPFRRGVIGSTPVAFGGFLRKSH